MASKNTKQQKQHFPEIGPRSIEGVEASDLPDKGRGPVEQDFGREAGRKLPHQTGGKIGDATDTGIRAMPDTADAKDHGPRGNN
jgi:hypothetical protein